MNDFWGKAVQAARSANILLDAGDPNGAVNRAYYGMFHAAISTLMLDGPDLAASKKHSTIIGRFSKHIVIGRGVDPKLGRALNLAFELRMDADYRADGVSIEDARQLVVTSAAFLAAMESLRTDQDE